MSDRPGSGLSQEELEELVAPVDRSMPNHAKWIVWACIIVSLASIMIAGLLMVVQL